MKHFWNRTAKKFGGKEDYTPVLIPSSKGLLNWYVDFLQRTALNEILLQIVGKRVLDLGCGVGRWSARLAATGVHVIGLDLSREMVKEAKKRVAKKKLSNVDFVVASVHNLPFTSRTFDAILSVTVLQHLVDKLAFRLAVSDIIRVVEAEGEIVLLEYFNKKIDNYSHQFPTITHNYKEAFSIDKKLKLDEIRGVDLSLFLRPFNYIIKKHGRYRDQLEGKSLSIRYMVLSELFYFLASLACVLSLPFDLAFRDIFLRHSEHTIYVFRR